MQRISARVLLLLALASAVVVVHGTRSVPSLEAGTSLPWQRKLPRPERVMAHILPFEDGRSVYCSDAHKYPIACDKENRGSPVLKNWAGPHRMEPRLHPAPGSQPKTLRVLSHCCRTPAQPARKRAWFARHLFCGG
jgi:hypothetical protein